MFLNGKKVFVSMFIPGASYTTDLKEALEKKGAKVVFSEFPIYDSDEKLAILAELEREKPDAVFICSPDLTRKSSRDNCEAIVEKLAGKIPVIVREAHKRQHPSEKIVDHKLSGATMLQTTTPDEHLGFAIADAISKLPMTQNHVKRVATATQSRQITR